VMTTSSAYVPGHATTVSPLAALATAALIVEKFAVAHEVPAAPDVALGDAYSVGSAAADAEEASASPAPPIATIATPANKNRLIRYPAEIIDSTFARSIANNPLLHPDCILGKGHLCRWMQAVETDAHATPSGARILQRLPRSDFPSAISAF
jgi:hypothetical protein